MAGGLGADAPWEGSGARGGVVGLRAGRGALVRRACVAVARAAAGVGAVRAGRRL